ncbi:Cerato-platanin [Crucibulum laeve]|uniref:Cerato-platanin n=1 Tax=Crucibulum laeve TaxID=68775 RepID=A0A5C3LT85_9AGAR|nr:Cerato-platanin [Crucibulum laeve]
MKFALTAALTFMFASTAMAEVLTYDAAYDVANTSLAHVSCSDGDHGLITRGYTTYGSLPKFPFIGAAVAITGYDSTNCGTCWQLTYTNSTGIKKSINVLAIDSTKPGYNIGFKAMDELTGGRAHHLGKVDVTAKKVSSSICGL